MLISTPTFILLLFPDIALEKAKNSLNAQIAAGTDLKKAETVEKVTLPTKEDIEAEKNATEDA